MNDVVKKLTVEAPLVKVWDALTSPQALSAWMNDESVQVDLRAGGKYTVFGGDTTGSFTRIEAPRHLEYTWRMAEWSKGWKTSHVSWTLRKQGDGTHITLIHSQFPNETERNSHDEGWDVYWLKPMKDWLERKA
jgi:uncharacterized protein YndB with AHSA1/START domain